MRDNKIKVKQNNKNSRYAFADILKTIAVFLVVTIHVGIYPQSVGSMGWYLVCAFDSLARISVPIFVMVSGMLFLNPDKEISVKTLYKKYILRIVISYAIWATIYGFYSIYELNSKNRIGTEILNGHYHMWYLWMTVGLYMFIPILRPIAKEKKAAGYFILICFLCGSVPQIITRFCGNGIENIIVNKLFLRLSFYFGYFMLGDYLCRHCNFKATNIMKKLILFGIWAAGTVITFLITAELSKKSGMLDQSFFEFTTPIIAIMSACIFKLVFDIPWKPGRLSALCGIVSKYSFGIYLVHPMVIYRFKYYGIMKERAICLPIYVIAVGLVSFGISAVIKNIPKIGKYIM